MLKYLSNLFFFFNKFQLCFYYFILTFFSVAKNPIFTWVVVWIEPVRGLQVAARSYISGLQLLTWPSWKGHSLRAGPSVIHFISGSFSSSFLSPSPPLSFPPDGMSWAALFHCVFCVLEAYLLEPWKQWGQPTPDYILNHEAELTFNFARTKF